MLTVDALSALRTALAPERVLVDDAHLAPYQDNVLGISRQLLAVVQPLSTEEVVRLVRAAALHGLPLHPISRGRNLGYSDRLPTRDGAVLVDLSRMCRIRSYDDVLGHVVVEAGVSQRQLHDFLQRHDSPFWMDATGAGLDSSVLGNSLEGGFGHSPRGNRRAQITGLEVVLGTGEVLNTGTFPGFGPDLAGMFVQSSYGIVTAMRIPLMRIPPAFTSFLAQTREDAGLEPLMDRLRELRQGSTLTSLVHVANAVRSYMTTRTCPPQFANRPMTQVEARDLMSTAVVRVGAWSAIGGLYGTAEEVNAHRRTLAEALRGVAGVRFFTHDQIRLLLGLLGARPWKAIPGLRGLTAGLHLSLDSFRHVHGLMCGIPSDEPQRNIAWRVADPHDMGLLWYGPTVEAVGTRVRRVVQVAEPLFHRAGFEMPITFTLVTPDRVVGAISISFNRHDPEQTKRAHGLYQAMREELAQEGVYGYRSGILGMDHVVYPQPGREEALRALKRQWDPVGILSPGRYGL